MKLEKAISRERKRDKKHRMIVENKSIFLLEELINKTSKEKFRKKRKQRILEKEGEDE